MNCFEFLSNNEINMKDLPIKFTKQDKNTVNTVQEFLHCVMSAKNTVLSTETGERRVFTNTVTAY